jgi:hypothetical protein
MLPLEHLTAMTAETVQQQKQQYSRQLAAYTFRQCNAVRESKPQESREIPEESVKQPDREGGPSKSPGEHTGAAKPAKGEKNDHAEAVKSVTFTFQILIDAKTCR